MKKLFEDASYKLEKKLAKAVFTLKIERETHVPDLMTRIRILPGVAVVAQKDKVARFFDGDAQLQISTKFLPTIDDTLKSIESICMAIKKLPGVKIIAVDEFNGRTVNLKGKKIVY